MKRINEGTANKGKCYEKRKKGERERKKTVM